MAFGPWIEHDGKGCPVWGQYVEADLGPAGIARGIAGSEGGGSWTWGSPRYLPVLRYRVHRSSAQVEKLRQIAQTPEEIDA